MFDDIFDEMRRMQKKMDQLFNAIMTSDYLLPSKTKGKKEMLTPLSDVIEDKDKVKIVMDMPGVDKKDIVIDLTPEGARIVAEKKIEKKESKKNIKRFERRYAGYVRYIPLPWNVDIDNAKASYKNGVLEIVIPKKGAIKKNKKKIKVE